MAGAASDLEVVTFGGEPVEVQVLPAVGARLHRLRAFGHDLLRTPDSAATHAADPFFWGAYVMAPWANRITAGPTMAGERTVDLPAGFPDGTAIHGQVAAMAWTRGDDGAFRVRMGGDGWPWQYEVALSVTVAAARVRLDLALTNLGEVTMPGGIGLHPWFLGPLELAVAGERVVPSNLDPTAIDEPVGGTLDLRSLGAVPPDLDATWLGVASPAVEIRWPALGLEATMRTMSARGVCVAVASPSAISAVAIEPQTHGPWGLHRFLANEPWGLRPLAPGGQLDLSIELDIRRFGRPAVPAA